jgi:hypothetical protein
MSYELSISKTLTPSSNGGSSRPAVTGNQYPNANHANVLLCNNRVLFIVVIVVVLLLKLQLERQPHWFLRFLLKPLPRLPVC